MKKIVVVTILCLIIFSSPVQAALLPVGSYQLPLSIAVSENNAKNAVLAGDMLNGTIILPGETFSYNQTVGQRTVERGFVDGLMFGDGEAVIDGTGGGVCMTSSILHQAVKAAGLKIIERHNHNQPTSYLPQGEDAAVVYGIQDYKFKNNTNNQLMITSQVTDDNLAIAINRILPEKDCSLHIVWDDRQIDVDSRLISNHNVSYLPLRRIAEAMGAEISWDIDTATARINMDNDTIGFPINEPEVTVNDHSVKLNSPAEIIDGQTMIPVRSICEAMGLEVVWDPATGTIQAGYPETVNYFENTITEPVVVIQDKEELTPQI